MAMDTSCLYTTVKNISGGTMKFAFLPPHGVELEDDEQLTIFGHITEAVNRGDRFGARWMDALKASVAAGYLDIDETPAVVMWDSTNEDNVIIAYDDDTVSYPAPCWDTEL